jgi:hypothetical protein
VAPSVFQLLCKPNGTNDRHSFQVGSMPVFFEALSEGGMELKSIHDGQLAPGSLTILP